ncbi:hypothetical protein C0039_07980 [Pseudohalioglobus lutimaris]|uniref:Uncharacterized protein n=2 Tax=Pseudohalioglobus lutimaris TaxID=1737061 RepID=A0A2N5X4P3_9GAMM|nr:hypothetical protein C0039_07980 [Pseudohalioglobus lutimaris]
MIGGCTQADTVLVCSGTVALTSDLSPKPEYVSKNFTVRIEENVWGKVINAQVSGDIFGVYRPENKSTDRELSILDSAYILHDGESSLLIDRYSHRFDYRSEVDIANLKSEGSGKCRESSGKI